jgi:hypothetical protein
MALGGISRGEELSDYLQEVAKGNVSGSTPLNKFGRNANVTASATEEVWDATGVYSWPATALITHVSQTTDQAALQGETVEVLGLDNDFLAVTQNVTLNASDTTTAVALTYPLRRVFRMKVMAAAVSTSTIKAHNAGETQDYAVISTGKNQTLMALYTVPASCTLYVEFWYANMNPATNKDPSSNQMELWVRDNALGYAPWIKHSLGLSAVASSQFRHPFEPSLVVPEKSDIFITSSPIGKAADVSAGFDGVLEAD